MHALRSRGAPRSFETLADVFAWQTGSLNASKTRQGSRNGVRRGFIAKPVTPSAVAATSPTATRATTTVTRPALYTASKTAASSIVKPAASTVSKPTPPASRPLPTSSTTTTTTTTKRTTPPIVNLTDGLNDSPPPTLPPLPTSEADPTAAYLVPSESIPPNSTHDWTRSFHGLSSTPFPKEAADILMQPIDAADIEIKPDGIIYLPEIKYRRILNRAFGPGGWGLAPRGETLVTSRNVTREYGMVVHGRLVSVARGEQQYFDPEGIPTATEGCKSNALMRCCKDLGIASELWDPVFIRGYMKGYARELWVEHVGTKKKRKITVKKGVEVGYPYKEVKGP